MGKQTGMSDKRRLWEDLMANTISGKGRIINERSNQGNAGTQEHPEV